jgi:hypothetical protein
MELDRDFALVLRDEESRMRRHQIAGVLNSLGGLNTAWCTDASGPNGLKVPLPPSSPLAVGAVFEIRRSTKSAKSGRNFFILIVRCSSPTALASQKVSHDCRARSLFGRVGLLLFASSCHGKRRRCRRRNPSPAALKVLRDMITDFSVHIIITVIRLALTAPTIRPGRCPRMSVSPTSAQSKIFDSLLHLLLRTSTRVLPDMGIFNCFSERELFIIGRRTR